ncbi:hypothetical protein HAX54_038006, partial [Datura stramonium]|nr:hypothetical protein [Datura stramonium]
MVLQWSRDSDSLKGWYHHRAGCVTGVIWDSVEGSQLLVILAVLWGQLIQGYNWVKHMAVSLSWEINRSQSLRQ